MSAWTYINGIVTVEPSGSGQRAMDFVIGSVVDHLPRVTGSERDMHVEIVRRSGTNCSSNTDELGQRSNLGRNLYNEPGGDWFDEQGTYDLLLEGAFRDRHKEDTLREFSAWMNRLSKRVMVWDVLVRLSDCYGWSKVFDGARPWKGNFEDWSWVPEDWHWKKRPELDPMYLTRRSSNPRFGYMPEIEGGNWVEHLAGLLPGGHRTAYELDYLAGNLEPWEYEDGFAAYQADCEAFQRRMVRSQVNLCKWEEAEDEEA